MKTKHIISIVVAGFFLFIMSVGGAVAEISIRDNETGGDCVSIGIWDSSAKTCTLITDLTEPITIDSDYITVDGNGHKITGDGMGYGIFLEWRTGVTLNNLTVEHFSSGILLLRSGNNTLTANTAILNFPNGIELYESDNNILTENITNDNSGSGIYITKSLGNYVNGNTARSNQASGIQLDDNCQNNTILGNTVTSGYGITVSGSSRNNLITQNALIANRIVGICLQFGSNNNIISNNTVSDTFSQSNSTGILISYGSGSNQIYNNIIINNLRGIWVDNSSNNQIYNNNFIENTTQAHVTGSSPYNLFSLQQPKGGNYWSTWTSPDDDGDGFVDQPYSFDGGQDYLPWANEDGWSDTSPPEINIVSPQARYYLHSDRLLIMFLVSDPSGLDTLPTATVDGRMVSNEESINLLSLPLGTHEFSVIACDKVGNCGRQSLTFNIIATIESLIESVHYLAQNGAIDADNILKSLLRKLNEAKDGMLRDNSIVAINKLNDFIDQVNAQVGKHITAEAGALFIKDAEYVLNTI